MKVDTISGTSHDGRFGNVCLYIATWAVTDIAALVRTLGERDSITPFDLSLEEMSIIVSQHSGTCSGFSTPHMRGRGRRQRRPKKRYLDPVSLPESQNCWLQNQTRVCQGTILGGGQSSMISLRSNFNKLSENWIRQKSCSEGPVNSMSTSKICNYPPL